MSNKKKRIGSKELRYLRRIDRLLDNHEQEIKQNNQSSNEEKVETELQKLSKIQLSSHAIKRCKERFSLDSPHALGHIRAKLKNAKRIGVFTDENGIESILYANGRMGIYVSTDYKEVRTVIKRESVTYEPIKNVVAEIHAKELRKLSRKEKACKNRLEEERIEVNLEIAKLERRLFRTRSEAVKMACKARINALNIHIKEKEDEIEQIKATMRQISRSMVAVV
ncbi:hypothetical protein CHH83_01655 [Bacillus sp. 7586-K]|nr:hypothetical protein CHH83_01655 [Bacillus sp. 7586-K]